MTTTRLVLVASAADAPPPRSGTEIVVVDTAWTPGLGDRLDLVPIRRPMSVVLARSDLFLEALDRVDAWGRSIGLVDLLTVDGISYWFRLRETLWNWLHERLLWWRIIGEVVADASLVGVEVLVDEAPLLDVAAALAARGDLDIAIPRAQIRPGEPAQPLSTARSLVAPTTWPRRVGRWVRRVALPQPRRPAHGPIDAAAQRAALLDERIANWGSKTSPRVLAVSLSVRHAIGSGGGRRFVDPHLDPIVARLREDGVRTGVMHLGLDHRRDADWAAMEADPGAFASSQLPTRWRSAPPPGLEGMSARLPSPEMAPLVVDGLDFGKAILDEVRRFTDRGLPNNARLTPAIEALLRDLRPDAILMSHEGHREPWIQASRRAGIPTFAVQHGILYSVHPGYAHPRHPARMLATRTFVYGDYERRVLVDHGAYEDDEVEVSGSPRQDLDRALAPGIADRAAERDDVRREIGIAAGDRLLVVSTTNGSAARRFYFPDLLGRLFDGPLPGVHVVFKQHPGETDEGAYRETVHGLAAAGGWQPPPMTVIRDIDLYRLLRAADAHLGFNSTVLTEAVLTATPNLIAAGQRFGDMLGYVAAGVARPIRTSGELAAALADPPRTETDARNAFIRDHFRDGDASARISSAIRTAITDPTHRRD